ncbi:10878_t:CDS:2 [Dentiscutata erythropus]|uniref:10878_t:CDS:1 n=1 Tax=Dentiscutata erythropus TaxID=1348616 RepID=A0A9N9HRM9_9GLOM|nr:10878_t:CDS:2 [Dentiscutata erythropus]
MILFVSLLSGKKITLKVFGTDTVMSVKQKIQDKEGTMYLFSCMNLFVVLPDGKTTTLQVFEDDTVESVKKKLFDKEVLNEDQKKLHEYNVPNEGKMYMTLRLLGGSGVDQS